MLLKRYILGHVVLLNDGILGNLFRRSMFVEPIPFNNETILDELVVCFIDILLLIIVPFSRRPSSADRPMP